MISESPNDDTNDQGPRPGPFVFAAIILTVSGFSISISLTYPVIALTLEARGFSEAAIGANGAMTGLGLLFAAPIMPYIAARLGYWRLLLTSAALTAGLIALFPVFDDYYVWGFLRVLMSASAVGLFVGGESWLNELADDRWRGRLIGIYSAVFAAFFAVGPLILPIVGYTGWLPYLVCIVVVLSSALPAMALRRWNVMPVTEKTGGRLFPILRAVPAVMMSVVAMGFFEAAYFALAPVYVVGQGYPETVLSVLVVSLTAGCILSQVPLGWLADRVDAEKILLACALIAGGALGVVPFFAADSWGAYAIMFVVGGATFGAYTLALTVLGRRYDGTMLAAAVACVGLAWGTGGTIGPALSGMAMDLHGPNGLMYSIAALYILLAFFTFCALSRREPET